MLSVLLRDGVKGVNMSNENGIKLNNQLVSYLSELQELADAEFGIGDSPNPIHEFSFTEEEYMIMYFAIKNYMAQGIAKETAGQVITSCHRLLERMLPDVRQFTKNKIQHLNQIRPEQFTSIETDYLKDSNPDHNLI